MIRSTHRFIVSIILAFCVTGIVSAQNFLPAKHVEKSDTIYIEIAPLKTGLNDIQNTVNKIMGQGGFTLLTTQIQAATGINFFDPEALRSIGINPDLPIGITVTTDPQTPGTPDENSPGQDIDPQVSVLLPATDGSLLYTKLKEIITEQDKKNKEFGSEGEPAAEMLAEIKPGELFVLTQQSKKSYVAKGKSHVIFSTSQQNAERMRNAAQAPVAGTDYYKSISREILKRNKNKPAFMAVYVNPESLAKLNKFQNAFLSRLQRGAMSPVPTDHPMIQESQENVTGAGGYLAVNQERIAVSFLYTYKAGYLADKTKIAPKMLITDAGPLTTDFFPATPVSYLMLRFNLPEVYEVVKTLLPDMQANMTQAEAQFNEQFGMSLENDVIKSLVGNFSAVLGSIPPEAQMKSISAWEGYASFGIINGSSANWNKLFKGMAAKLKKQASTQPKARIPSLTSEDNDEGKLWVLTRKGGFGNAKGVKSESILFLVRNNEVIVTTTRKNLEKVLKKSSTLLSERLVKLEHDKTTSLLYFNIPAVIKSIEKSSMKMVAAPYLSYFAKIAYISAYSAVEGDIAVSDFSIKLK